MKSHLNKNIFLCIIFCCCLAKNSSGKSTDSFGVYFTQDQFRENLIQFKTPYWIKEKAGFVWSVFDFEAEGVIRLRTINKEIKIFQPGSLAGFYYHGIRFLYSSRYKKYFAVLNDASPLYFFVDERESIGFRTYSKYAGFLFGTNIDSLQDFTKENIKKNFASIDDSLYKRLDTLYNFIDDYRNTLSRHFDICQKAVKKCLYE